jgi:membrane protein YdbS with pleckstrin-like domain
MAIYVHRNGVDHGPYQEEDMRSFLQTGRFSPSDHGWREGMADWMPLANFEEFASVVAPARAAPHQAASTSANVAGPRAAAPRPASVAGPRVGGYAAATLQPGESPLFKTTLHPIKLVPGLITGTVLGVLWYIAATIWLGVALPGIANNAGMMLAGAITAGALGFGLPVLAAYVNWRSSELLVTNRRVLIKIGFLRRRTLEMFVSKIESVSVTQGIFGRVLGFGTVGVRGTGGSSELFNMITRPVEFRNHVQRAQSLHEVL